MNAILPNGSATRQRCTPPKWLVACVSIVAALVTFLVSTSAQAIPAFARRYQSSCQTCHLAFPKLTPFGEAFRRNGYRFPSGGDATAEKEEPIPLGAEAQKDVWPRAVWPGQLPGTVPLSFVIDAKGAIGPALEGHAVEGHSETPAAPGAAPAAEEEHAKTTLSFKDTMARIVGGGTLGSIGSYFGAVSFGGHETAALERGFIILTPVDQTSLHLKVGLFEPALHGVSIHRGLFGHQLRLTTTPVKLNSFTPEASLKGFEASGLIIGRLGWAAGVVENTNPATGLTSDMYGRLETKLGGMRWDGVDSAAGSAAWRERSFSLGVSGYRGRSKISETLSVPGTVVTHNDTFIRFGGDAHVVLDDLLLDVVVARQRHDAPELKGVSGTMDIAYAELTYVVHPWVFPTLRGEASRVKSGDTTENRWIGLFALNTVVRPNLVLRGEVAIGKDPGSHSGTGFRFAALSASVAF